MDLPPTGLTTNHDAEVIITVTLAVLVACFVAAGIRMWRGTGRPDLLLLLLGGALCSFNEPIIDLLVHCYFPADGWTAFTVFERAIPVWVVLAYTLFYGGLTYVLAQALRNGVTRRAIWIGCAAWGALNLAMEIPLLQSDLYVYYGAQPFRVGGFPLGQVVFNVFGDVLGAVVLLRLGWLFVGRRRMLLIGLPLTTFFTSWLVGWPYFIVLGMHSSMAARMAAAALAVAIGLFALDVAIRVGTGRLRFSVPELGRRTTEDQSLQASAQ